MARKKSKDEQDVIYARMHDPKNMRYLYKVMADTNQPLREVLECMIEFCRSSKRFKVPLKVTTAERLAIAQKGKEERLRAKATG